MAVQETTTQTILPAWYTQYAQNLTGKAMAAAEEPYQAYNLPRIAGFTPEQEQAYAMAPEKAASYQPYLSSAGTLATAGGAGSSAGIAQPYLQAGTTSFTAPGVSSQYMSPYIQNVVSGIGQAAARNLSENLLPAVNRTFVGGGTFGGSRSADFTARAVRDANAAALSQQAQALQQGYTQAADLYGQEAGRQITAGTEAGKLASTDYDRMVAAAKGLGALGETAQNLGLKEAQTLEGIGAQRQALGQKSADLAYQDFVAQREYPWTQLQKMSSVAGTPSGTGSTTVTQTPAPSTTSQVLGNLAGIAGILGESGAFKSGGWLGLKDGGEAKKKKAKAKAGLGWLKDKR